MDKERKSNMQNDREKLEADPEFQAVLKNMPEDVRGIAATSSERKLMVAEISMLESFVRALFHTCTAAIGRCGVCSKDICCKECSEALGVAEQIKNETLQLAAVYYIAYDKTGRARFDALQASAQDVLEKVTPAGSA